MARSQDEFKLGCAVAKYLRTALPPRVLWSHLPFGEHRNEVTGSRLKSMGTQRGWPDYLVIANEGVLALELKAPKGKLSPEQIAFADAHVAAGGAHAVCRSLDEVEAALRRAGLPVLASVGA